MVVWAPAPGERSIEEVLQRLGSDVLAVESRDQLERVLLMVAPDLIIARLTPDFRAPLEYLAALRGTHSSPCLVVLVERWDKGLYYEALQLGAFDGIILPFDEKELLRIAMNAAADDCLLLSA
ncbi:MAG: hypothetical protein ACRD5G_12635 [Candidatus Acidiferrales bacterium]